EGSGKWIVSQKPEAGSKLKQQAEVTLIRSDFITEKNSAKADSGTVIIPDLTGLSMRQAVHFVANLGLKAKLNGSGTVQKQYPAAGKKFKKGRTILIRGNSSFKAKAAIR